MKGLDEYFLMAMFMLLLKRDVFENFMFHLDRETWQWKS